LRRFRGLTSQTLNLANYLIGCYQDDATSLFVEQSDQATDGAGH
jgi:hypothetical protein